MFRTGVTRFFPTVITGSPEGDGRRAAQSRGGKRNLAGRRRDGSVPCGRPVHLARRRTARRAPGALDPPARSLDEFHRFQDAARGHIRLVTLSPEWPEAPRFIEAIVREGVVASIGHTKATSGEIAAAVDAGATLSTHLGNGAHAVLPRRNYIWDQLADDRLAASFIVDGIHLAKSFLNVALRAKGLERSILVTDAVMPAGCAPGRYRLGEMDVELTPTAACAWRAERAWPVQRCAWIAPSERHANSPA